MKKGEIDADKIVIKEIYKGLESIDKTYQVDSIDIKWFAQLVENEQALLKKKFRRDLLAFLLIALFILSMVFITLLEAPILFIICQVILTIVIPIIAYYLQQHKQRVVHQ